MDSIAGVTVTIIDAMEIAQKMHGENITFEEVSHQVMQQVLPNGWKVIA